MNEKLHFLCVGRRYDTFSLRCERSLRYNHDIVIFYLCLHFETDLESLGWWLIYCKGFSSCCLERKNTRDSIFHDDEHREIADCLETPPVCDVKKVFWPFLPVLSRSRYHNQLREQVE